MNKEEQEVLDKNDHVASYYYCCYNEGANISLHEDIVCRSNEVDYILHFARDVKVQI